MKRVQDGLIGKQALLYVLRSDRRTASQALKPYGLHGLPEKMVAGLRERYTRSRLIVMLSALLAAFIGWSISLEIRIGSTEKRLAVHQDNMNTRMQQLDEKLDLLIEQQQERNIRETTERIEALSKYDVELEELRQSIQTAKSSSPPHARPPRVYPGRSAFTRVQ